MKARWLFFPLFASLAMPGRFMSIFYQEHNLDQGHIGILMAIPSLISLAAGPLICNIADRLERRALVASVTYGAAIVFFLAQIVALPSLGILSPSARFQYLLVVRVLNGFFSSGVYPLVSAIAISQLRKEHGERGPEYFGQERLWGAVSWAMCALLLGAILDVPGMKVWIVHVGVLIFGGLFLFSVYTFSNFQTKAASAVHSNQWPTSATLVKHGDEQNASQETSDGQDPVSSNLVASSTAAALSKIMCSGGLGPPFFFNLIFWLAVGMSLVENLLFLFFENDLHASNLLCGISVVVTVVFEIPIFAKAPELLERLGAPVLAMIGSSAFVIRGFGYTLAPNGWFVLFFEPLHGVTYGAFHTAAVAYIAERTPPELDATGQSLLAVVQGLGQTLGTTAGGYIMQQYGSKALYRAAAMVVMSTTVAFGVIERLCQDRRQSTSSKPTRAQAHTIDDSSEEEMVALTHQEP